MKTERKRAIDLKSGDILFARDGERIGMVTTDARRVGWSGTFVEYGFANDEGESQRRDITVLEYDVQPWQPSQAV